MGVIAMVYVIMLVFICIQISFAQDNIYEKMSPKEVFETLCSSCHGKDGGSIPENQWRSMGLDVPPANFRDKLFSSKEPLRDWINVIRDGGEKHGFSKHMPSFKDLLSEEKIRELALYLKSLGYDKNYPQGEMNFTRGFWTTKAFPEDEFLYIGGFTNYKDEKNLYKQTFYLGKRFGPAYQWEIKASSFHQSGVKTTGEIEGGLKWAFYHNLFQRFIAAIGAEVSLPVNSDEKWSYSPYIAIGKGFGERLSLQLSSKFIHTPDTKEQILRTSGVLHYLTSVRTKRTIVPGIEIKTEKNLRDGSGIKTWIIPQIYAGLSKRGHVAFALGFEKPLFDGAKDKYSIRAFILWDFAEGGFLEGW